MPLFNIEYLRNDTR